MPDDREDDRPDENAVRRRQRQAKTRDAYAEAARHRDRDRDEDEKEADEVDDPRPAWWSGLRRRGWHASVAPEYSTERAVLDRDPPEHQQAEAGGGERSGDAGPAHQRHGDQLADDGEIVRMAHSPVRAGSNRDRAG